MSGTTHQNGRSSRSLICRALWLYGGALCVLGIGRKALLKCYACGARNVAPTGGDHHQQQHNNYNHPFCLVVELFESFE